MKRRTIIAGVLVIAIALGATLSTVRARQALAEDQAHARLLAAQRDEAAMLQRAASDGLGSADLAPFVSAAGALAAQKPPDALPFWSSNVATFYDRQARSYGQIAKQVKLALRRVTLRTREHAASRLRALAGEIARARSLDVDPRGAQAALATQMRAFGTATLLRQYRDIAAALVAPATSLAGETAGRQQYVSSVLAQTHNTLREVIDRADAETAAAEKQLLLLGLLTSRAAAHRAVLAGRNQAVHGQTSAFGAAVKEYALHLEVAGVAMDYAKTVPSKMIVVSTERQWATMYQDGKVVDSTPVTTGGPELPTDHGVFHVYMKASPWVFHSPWPPGSPYYYPPTPIQYWMPFDGGEGLHDAWWRSNFGPGSNLQPTNLGTGNYILGTHGCVNLPMDAATFVWNWAPVGTTVVVV